MYHEHDCFACGHGVRVWQDDEGTIHNHCDTCGYHFRNDYAEQESSAGAADGRSGAQSSVR